MIAHRHTSDIYDEFQYFEGEVVVVLSTEEARRLAEALCHIKWDGYFAGQVRGEIVRALSHRGDWSSP